MSYWDSVLKLVLAFVVGTLIGWERERNNRPAGLRTHIIVCISSCLALIISSKMFLVYEGRTNMDPSRMAAYVISGIGFLGAGTIMREGSSVKGLTTAASLWAVALLGISIGVGFYAIALTATGIILFTLLVVNKFEHSVLQKYNKPHRNYEGKLSKKKKYCHGCCDQITTNIDNKTTISE